MHWPSGKVRDTFIQYFLRHPRLPHAFVPSSSIVPKNDPTLAFTNAGMNQFKDVILGYGQPKYARAANSQKCLRINDLHLVGTDTYHQTFFEMLGNWSFSNYFKAEACAMAWDLLTNTYQLDPSRLYVTYFAGGDSVPADLETKQVWENLGIDKSRILPFGKENFWTMGPIGPCGPSTEIHYDHRGVVCDPSQVNQDSGMVVEVWNLVFMQYNRNETGKLERLPLSHVVDTGAGLERLTAVLNQRVSNYDTDLFYPIFDTVQKMTGITPYSASFESDLDLCYRIFADHMRAVTVTLSDGVLPQTNQKIRRLIQRSLSVTQTHFIPTVDNSVDVLDFLEEVVDTISTSLSPAYPEIEQMQHETISVLSYEVKRYLDFIKEHKSTKVKNQIVPPLLAAEFPQLNKIPKQELEGVKKLGKIDGKTAFSWYERHGVVEDAMEELAVSFGIQFDPEELKEELSHVKKKFRDEVTRQILTNEERLFVRKVESLLALYDPKNSGGVQIPLGQISVDNPVFIEWVFDEEGDPVEEISEGNTSYWIVLNKSPFITGDASIESDVGSILLDNNCRLFVTNVKQLPSGWIIHQVRNVPEIGFSRRTVAREIEVDNERKLGREMSKTALRYFKNWLRKKYGIVRFGSELVIDKEFTIEFTVLDGVYNSVEIEECQHWLNEYAAPIVVTRRTLKKNNEYQVVCATGLAAEVAMRVGWEISKAISELRILMKKCESEFAAHGQYLQELIEDIRHCTKVEKIPMPHDIAVMATEALLEAEKLVAKQESLKEITFMSEQIVSVNEPFVVKAFATDVELSSLKKITRAAGSKPVMVLVHSSDGFIQGRCVVPPEYARKEFTAEKWMDCFVTELGRGQTGVPRGQDPNLVMLMKRVKVQQSEERLRTALEKATEYAREAISLPPSLTSSTSSQSNSHNNQKPHLLP